MDPDYDELHKEYIRFTKEKFLSETRLISTFALLMNFGAVAVTVFGAFMGLWRFFFMGLAMFLGGAYLLVLNKGARERKVYEGFAEFIWLKKILADNRAMIMDGVDLQLINNMLDLYAGGKTLTSSEQEAIERLQDVVNRWQRRRDAGQVRGRRWVRR